MINTSVENREPGCKMSKEINKHIIVNEEGSIMVEAAIIFPIIIIVVFALITFSLIVHDVYVSRLLIDVISEESHEVDVKGEIDKRIMAKHFVKKVTISNKSERSEAIGNEHKIVKNSITYDIPFVGVKNYEYEGELFKDELIQKIMLIEMTGDIFDDLTMSKGVKDKYDLLLKSVMSGLEND